MDAELLLRHADVLKQAGSLQTFLVYAGGDITRGLAPQVPQAAAAILGLQRLRRVRLETGGASAGPTVIALALALGEGRPGLVEVDTSMA